MRTTEGLLRTAGSAKGRKDLAASTGLSEKLILEWVKRADLMRVRGVGEEYSDLLEQSGVDSCKELTRRKAESLHGRMHEVNAQTRLVRRPPPLGEVRRWIDHATTLGGAVTH